MGCDIHPNFEVQTGPGRWKRWVTGYDELYQYLYFDESEGEDEEPVNAGFLSAADNAPVQRTSVRKSVRKVGRKSKADKVKPEPRKPVSQLTEEERDQLRDKLYRHELRIDRNYDLFAILANVRNGVGFAGIPTGSGFEPISMPRGIPTDISESVLKRTCYLHNPKQDTKEEWEQNAAHYVESGYSRILRKDPLMVSDPDYHSHSWFLLSELVAYDWNAKTTIQPVFVEQSAYAAWKQGGAPSPAEQFRVTEGYDIRCISEEEMVQRIANGLPPNPETVREVDGVEVKVIQQYFCETVCPVTYRDCCSYFVDKTIPALKKYADEKLDGDYTRLRFVFWFDN